jgi:DNA-binding response OmpR family regulator
MARLPDQDQLLKNLQILLVEDEADIADLLMFVLEEAGAEVTLVTYAGAALQALENYQPDILLCNVKLPDRQGDWLIEQIRDHESAQEKTLPAIALTSYTREVSEGKVLAAGFQQFMDKPFEPDHLITEVLRLVRHSREESYKRSFISNSKFSS